MEDSVNYRNLGDRIRKVRRESRLSQKVFSKLCGVSPLTLMRYESGSRGPDARFLVRLCENFNVNANWMLAGQGGMFLGPEGDGGNGGPGLDASAVSVLFQEFAAFLKTRSHVGGETEPAAAAAKTTGSVPGILVVSPDRTFCQRIRSVLARFAREVIEAASSREAERIMNFRRFALVALDSRVVGAERRRLLERVRDANEAAVLLFGPGDNLLVEETFPPGRIERLGQNVLEDGEILLSAGRLLSASAYSLKT
ncbi:helix-turn-helix domain-containing protein [bacterium]|nr:helix-turn-helix domain-containing protein [bacterium]